MSKQLDHSEGHASYYRAYLIGDGGKVETATPLEAADDETAIEKARQLMDGHLIELWDRTRLIAKLAPDDSSVRFAAGLSDNLDQASTAVRSRV